jgi:hypothetical protein
MLYSSAQMQKEDEGWPPYTSDMWDEGANMLCIAKDILKYKQPFSPVPKGLTSSL